MNGQRYIIALPLLFLALTAGDAPSAFAGELDGKLMLTQEAGSRLSHLALECVHREFPNKPGHAFDYKFYAYALDIICHVSWLASPAPALVGVAPTPWWCQQRDSMRLCDVSHASPARPIPPALVLAVRLILLL